MKIYLATWIEESQGEALNKISKRERLLSYFFLRDYYDGSLKDYYNFGNFDFKQKKNMK